MSNKKTIEEKLLTVRRFFETRLKRLDERIEKLEYLTEEMKSLKKTFANQIKKEIK